jgi:S-adenosylmethionine hydrolase
MAFSEIAASNLAIGAVSGAILSSLVTRQYYYKAITSQRAQTAEILDEIKIALAEAKAASSVEALDVFGNRISNVLENRVIDGGHF